MAVLMSQISLWWQHSFLAQIWALLRSLTSASILFSPHSLAVWLIVLLIFLPYLSTSQIGLLLLGIGAFYLPLTHNSTLKFPLISYSIVATIATVLSPVRLAAVDGLIKLLLYFIVFLSIEKVFLVTPKYRSYLVGSYILTNLLVTIGGLRQQFFGAQQLATWWDPSSELSSLTRVYSFLGNPNLLAGYLLPAIPFGVVAILLTKRWTWKLLITLSTLGSFLCIIYSYSRGAWLGLGTEVMVLGLALIYWRFTSLSPWALPAIGLAMGGAMAGGIMAKPSLRARILSIFSIFDRNVDQSISFRLRVMAGAVEMVKEYPLFGIGPGNRAFNLVYPLFQKVRHSALGAYSVPLELTIETGFIGLIVYSWLVITVLIRGIQAIRVTRNLWAIGGMAAVLGMIVHGLGDTVWYRPQVQILWWLSIALVMVNPGTLQENRKEHR